MLTKKLIVGLAALGLLTTGALTGCAADTAEAEEAVEESESDLTAAGKALIGSYKDDSGAFRGLILTSVRAGQANEFTADVDTGVRCIVAPCPSSERITGTFTAGAKTITLRSTTASSFSKHLLGKYNYLVQGDKFSLSRKGFAQSLEKVPSYCAQSADCYEQDIIHPMCMGGFTCTAQSTCKWSCGMWPPPAVVCAGLEQSACEGNASCAGIYGPSWCSPGGICSKDFAFKGCQQKP